MRLVNIDDAVKALEQAYPNDGQMSCHDAVAVIGTVPTIEPRKGTWLKEDRGGVEYTAVCSECGYSTFWSDVEDYNFCPCCGFPMTEREENV